MHLADAFIQSDLQSIQAVHVFINMCSLGIEPNALPLSHRNTCSCLHVTAPNTVHPPSLSSLSLSLSLSLSESTPVWRPCWRSSMMLTEKNMRVFKQCGGLRQQAGPGQPSTLPKQNYSFHCPCTSMNSALNICSVSFSESLTFLCTPGLRRIWTASNRDCSLSPQHTFNSHSPGTVIATVVQSVLQFFLSQVILKKNTISLVKHPAHLPFLTTPYYQKYICSF